MLWIVHNADGSIWSRTAYDHNVPVGNVYCTNELGDTVQYYYHSKRAQGAITFTALINVPDQVVSYTGNPIHSITLSKDTAHPGDSIWVDIEVCDLRGVSHSSRLLESMLDRNERLVHEPVIQHGTQSSFLLVPQAIGEHMYDYSVDLKGFNSTVQFNRTFKITVVPRP